jgi:hypothetical protein
MQCRAGPHSRLHMIHSSRLDRLHATYPEVMMGVQDARAGVWREIRSHEGSMAYEIGRMLAVEPPARKSDRFSLGIWLVVPPLAEKAIAEMGF